MNFFIKTFGCQMNEADTQEMSLAFVKKGFYPASNLKNADIALLNTCTVRDHAEHRAISYLGRLKIWKKNKKERKIIFAGCAAQRLQNEIYKRFPFVDLVTGAKSIEKFPQALDKIFHKKNIKAENLPKKSGLISSVTIMRGCNHQCSYCIVPFVRGKATFKNPNLIFEQVKNKVESGAKEITLLGQTVNSYKHPDCKNFSELLKELSKISELKRIRFMSPHPLYITDELIKTMAETPKIARHIHMPIQSGSNKILKLMNRGYTKEYILKKIQTLKKYMPDIAISTDFIVGFPTETKDDFMQTLLLMREVNFSFAYCFKYSPRENTISAKMPNDVSQETAEKRLKTLLQEAKKSSHKNLEAQVGTIKEVLCETQNCARTSSNYWVKLEENFKPGEILNAKVTKKENSTLIART